MDSTKAAELIHILMEMNNERLKTYEIASMQVKELELKLLFSRLTQTSKRCNEKLNASMLTTGGAPAGITRSTIHLFNFWMEVSAILLGNDHLAIVQSCESAEIHILKKYTDILSNEKESFSEKHYAMISEQYAWLQSDYEEIGQLKKQFSTVKQ